jgi:hypothetical protein
MKSIGDYVETGSYRKQLEKYGFKYSPVTRSMVLSYPFVPKKYIDQAVRIEMSDVNFSKVSKIENIEFYKRGSGYKKEKEPPKGFREYVDSIVQNAVKVAAPRNFLA